MADACDFTLTLPARSENVALVRHAIGSYARSVGVGDGRLGGVLLAVTEACTNVVIHAYGEAGGELEVDAIALGDERLLVTVRDHGSGIRPQVDGPGLGLGLPVIASVSEGVEIRPARGGGTEVAMTFRLDDAA